LEKIKAGQSY